MQAFTSKQDPEDKIEPGIERRLTADGIEKTEVLEDDGEVFRSHTGKAEFRALGWYGSILFLALSPRVKGSYSSTATGFVPQSFL